MVGWYYIPRRVTHTRRTQRIFESGYIVVPKIALGIVGFADLPVVCRIVEPLLEARELLSLADMQKEFQDSGSTLEKLGLEVADAIVTCAPGRLVNQLVDSRDQHVLVVRAVEDRHPSL